MISMRTVTTTTSFPWVPGKRSTREERLQLLDLILKVLVPAFLFVCFVAALKYGSFNGYLTLLSRQSFATPLLGLGAGFTLCVLGFQLVRTILWWRYRPYPLPQGNLPSVTVIIPAYNEGAMVEKALYSAAASDYPADKLEIICIDDGSKDDTWTYIDRARQRYPDLIKAIRFPRNRGKKEGLYAGFTQGKGEIFVTMDSDSVIGPDTLKQLVAPMVHDPQIGAVAGNVKVYNRFRSLLARMLAVRFVLAFDFLRASQSMYGFVACTPGALSAYRRKAVLPILEKWRHQTFLGVPAIIGEDRALTNFVLRQGYYSVYQRTAQVYTVVPETYKGLCKMFLRWDRANFRESWVQLTYMFTRYRSKDRLLPILDFFITQMEFPLTYLFMGLLLFSFYLYPIVMVKFFAGLGVLTMIYMLYYLTQERDWEFIYGIIYSYFAFFALNWVQPYAFLTLRNSRWLTR
jgi:hyaluronan synthase|uniref:Glycosyltransferase n=1 Tax=Desulfobacca acetoxidans TaxID=60893 RepID=A0A7C3WIU7_9BACT